jgi:tape measure domain-containing protein
MQINNGRLGYTITLDNKQVQQLLAQTRADFARTSEYAISEVNKVQSKMSSLAILGGTFLSASAAKGFVTELIHIRGEFQQIENAIETITGSQEAMNGLMTEWKDLTLRSPFGLSEIAQSGKQLLAYGVEVGKVTSDIEMLGNIASGVSAPINDVAYLYGTLKTQGRAYQQDINQFTGRGIPIIKELAKQFGVAESEIRNLTEAGKIGFPEVEKALKAMTSEGGQFFNLIGKQATTLTGAVNRLKHEIELMFNQIGTDTEGILSGSIDVATHLVEHYDTIGKTLGILISTYGAYKAAIIVTNAVESARAKTVATEIANLSISQKMQLGRLAVTQRQAQASLTSAQAELANSNAILTTMRSEVSALSIKRQKAVASAMEARNNVIESQTKLASARAELTAIEMTGTARQVSIAQKNVERAQNTVIASQEQATITRKNALSASQTFNNAQQNLGNQAQKTKIAQTAVSNAQDAVGTATKNLNTAATTRLTLAQHRQALSAKAAAAWQAFLNATMLSNPIVAVVAAVGGLVAAYFILRDTTTDAEKAQEAYNKTQEKLKSGLDETKKKAEEYINVIKDETATVYQQIQAYKALQSLRLSGIENLSQEQLATMDLVEIRKLLNQSIDDKGLSSQKKALVDIENQIKLVKKQIEGANKSSASSGAILDHLYKRLDVLNIQYDKQLNNVFKIEREMKFSNMTIEQKKKYWEDVISTTEKQIYTLKNVNSIQNEGLETANLVSSAFQSWDISRLNSQLGNAHSQLLAINGEISKTAPVVQDKSYWDNEQKVAEDKLSKLDPNDPKNKKEWIELSTKITKAKDALKAWDIEVTKVSKPKKPKAPKKSDDPVEIFKKQVQGMKDEYDRYVNYMNTDDIVLKATANIRYSSLTKQGANYEDYLRNIQKQLANVTNKTKVQIKELQFVNDELAKIIDYNAFDKYKDGINEQIDSSENLLKIIGLLQEEKQKFANSSNPIEQEKFKFLDEKEIENIKKADDAAKSLIDTLKEEFNPLDSINKKFDAEIEILKFKLEKAKDDIEKQEIVIAIKQVETKRTEALEDTPTNDKYVNEILKKYQTLEQKKQKIIDDSNREIQRMQENLQKELNKTDSVNPETITQYENVIKEIKDKQIEAVKAVDAEILKKSESWIQIFGDYSNKSSAELLKILDRIRNILNDPTQVAGLTSEQLKAYQDQFTAIKEKIEKDNPFDNLKDSFKSFMVDFKNGFKDVDGKIKLDNVRGLVDATKKTINETLNFAEDLGINISESTRDAIELGAELFNAGADIAEGIASKDPVKIIQGLAKAVKSVLNFNDKKKQRQIKQYQQAVDDLARSFKNLQYETDKALGGDTYKNQRTMLDNLTKQQEEYRKMIKTEQSRKKTDQGKIKEWQQAIIELDQSKQDLLDSLAQDILQTNAKDLANTLGDALAEAFGKGEDAAKSFEKVANDVLKNAVLNQLKKKFLEDQLQGALDQLYKDMGADGRGNFEFNGLSQEEQEKFRERLKEISKNFSGALEMYSDLFKDLEMDPNENSLSGAISGMSQETASIVAGQVNAMRLLIVEANKQRDLSNKFLMQQLDRLANIDANTRMMEPLLNKLIDKVDKLGENRSYGF